MVVFAFFGDKKPTGELDIEHVLNDMSVREGKIIEREDVKYVKPIDIDGEGKNLESILGEIQRGNVVVLNVRALSHNKLLLRAIVKELRDACTEIDGDIAKLSEEKIIVLPGGMKISHAEGG